MNQPPLLRRPKTRAVALCAAVVGALFATAAFAPLPYTLTWPGDTADTLGSYQGHQVLTITGAQARQTSGQLRMVTITATGAGQTISLWDALRAWGSSHEAVVPSEAVYPQSNPAKANQATNEEMVQSQDSATTSALNFLRLPAGQTGVKIDLGDIGGPSAGLMLSLGIVDKLAGDGKGGDLSGGKVVAGTGTIDDQGQVAAVGGVPLKTQAAARDGATVFLVPKGECSDAKVNTPAGLRLVPVTSLAEAVSELEALNSGSSVPSC